MAADGGEDRPVCWYELLGDEWLVTPCARWLQDVLWRRPATPPEPFKPLSPTSSVADPEAFRGLLRPPEHVVMVMNSNHGAAVQIVLFARDRYVVPLGVPIASPTVWWIDPVARRHRRMSFEQFGARLLMRQLAEAA